MATRIEIPFARPQIDDAPFTGSAVSWAAIAGGAIGAAAIALILIQLGLGLGLDAVSPWSRSGPSATSFSIAAGVWLIVVEWIAAAVGGYLAGRLRTKWVGLHTDEVYFRDTAHGLLSWALATVAVAILIGWAAFAAAAAGVAGAGNASSSYFADLMFRPAQVSAVSPAQGADPRAEAGRILVRDAASGGLTQDDRGYLSQLVAARTGLSQPDADKRVDDVSHQVMLAADSARKASASAAIIGALALLIGGFIASAAGALGGKRRDSY
jgi:hypothetical protein